VPEPKGCEPELGGLEITDGVFTRPTENTEGCIVDRRDRDRGQITRAHQAGQWDGVTPVSLDAIAGLVGHPGWGDDPAVMALLRQLTLEPVATRPRCIDQDQGLGLGWPLAHAWINSGLPGADGAEGDDLSVVVFGDVGDGTRVLMDIHADVPRARLAHG
jgi:hypothetical protein